MWKSLSLLVCALLAVSAFAGSVRAQHAGGGSEGITDAECNDVLAAYEHILSTNNVTAKVTQLSPVSEGSTGSGSTGAVCTYTIDLKQPQLLMSGWKCKSGLCNAALGSFERAVPVGLGNLDRLYLNLFEIMVPDTPNFHGSHTKSRGQLYVEALDNRGLKASIAHFHWWGQAPFVAAIHTQNFGMEPVDFATKVAQSLKDVDMVAGSM